MQNTGGELMDYNACAAETSGTKERTIVNALTSDYLNTNIFLVFVNSLAIIV